MVVAVEEVGLQELLAQRDKELQNFYASLQEKVTQREAQCADLTAKLKTLQDDFIYNIRLLEERDKELERSDAVMDGLKATIHDREVRISELKILLNERSTELSNMKLLLQTQEQQHIDIVRKVQRESEATAQRYDDQLLEQREALETQRTSFLLQIKTLEQDIQIQRDGFTEELQRAKRSQQVEMQLYKQELNQKLLQADQKIATAHAELNVVKSARNDLESKLQQQMDTNKSLTKQLRDLQWETADSAKIATTRIVELEEALRQSQEQAASDFEVYEENRRRVQSQLEESNQCLEREKSSAKQQIQSLLTELASTNAQLREASEQHKNEVSTLMRTVNEKQEQLEHLHKELNEGQGSTQELIGKCAAEILVRDRQLEKQTATIHELQEELKVLVADVDTYRRDIAKLLESHSLLEKQREEERQSWEQKLDSLRRQAQREGNSTIHALLAAKESAEAEVKLLRSQLRMNPHRNDGQGATSWDDRLVSTPYPTDDYVISGQPERTNIPNKAFEAQAQAAIIELEQENDKLRTIIHQMRQDMEVMQRAMTQPSYHGCNDSHPIRRPRTAEPVLGESGNSQVHILQGLLKEKQSIIDRLLEQQQRLHELLEQSSKRAEQGNGRDSGTLEKALDNNRELRQKLAEAVEDMRVMTSERSRLMDMSNALKAEIRYWMEKHSNKVDATTQTALQLTSARVTRKTEIGLRPASQKQPVKQSARVTDGQRAVHERITAKRAVLSGINSIADSRNEEAQDYLRKLELRTKGVRNWNDGTDEDSAS